VFAISTVRIVHKEMPTASARPPSRHYIDRLAQHAQIEI